MSADSPAPLNPQQVADLCAKAAAGDRDAIECLLIVHHDRLLSYTRRKLGVDFQAQMDAEDVLQEAYADVFAGIADFTPQGDDAFYHWAARIIDHRFIDQVRRLRRKKRDAARVVRLDGGDSGHSSLLDLCLRHDARPSVFVKRDDAVGALMACVSQLPEHYRLVVQALYLDQRPAAELAAEMGRSEDAVRRLGTRAVERLAECLGRASRYLSTFY